MSRKRKKGAKATAASMVMDTLKKRGAVDDYASMLHNKVQEFYAMV